MWTIRQAAEQVGVQPKVIRRLLAEGKLAGATKAGGNHGAEMWRLGPDALTPLRKLNEPARPAVPQSPTAVARSVSQPIAALPLSQVLPQTLTEAEIVARHLAAAAPALNGGHVPVAKDHLVPMTVVVELLRSEAEQRRAAQRMAEDQTNTVALLRQANEADRDEILRLRNEVGELKQELQQAQRGLLVLQKKPMRQVDQERVTQPLDLATMQRIAAMN